MDMSYAGLKLFVFYSKREKLITTKTSINRRYQSKPNNGPEKRKAGLIALCECNLQGHEEKGQQRNPLLALINY